MAADLQDPPSLVPLLLSEWQKGAKIVWGVRAKREGEKTSTTFFSRLYYQLMNLLTTVKMPPSGADVFLVDRDVINAFKEMNEKHTSVFMTLAWLGFKQADIHYVKQARMSGRSKWSLRNKIKMTLDSLLAFSDVPIRAMSILGFLTAFIGFLYAVYVFYSHMTGSPVEGWSSLMVGILVIGGQVLTAFAFVIPILALMAEEKQISEIVSADRFHDLGKLLLAFIMLWAYFSLSQFLIIWAGNLPEEIPWYLNRLRGGWQWIGGGLILFHFALPFVILLSRDLKRSARRLALLALGLICLRFIDLFWLVTPAFSPGAFSLHWMDVVAAFGVGGIWLAMFVWQLKGRPLIPLHDPSLAEEA